ncbi:hypothetical protein BC833DRAFT_529728 [Globomyces pollinis-pini]|nr:hypothetical protein BC833DRAFT_529728 [Globomyces pollinis-pini]
MTVTPNLIYEFNDTPTLSKALNNLILTESKKAITERGLFSIALSGGSIAKQLAAELPKYDVTNWHFFFADERCVPLDSEDSNYLGFVGIFESLNVPKSNIHTINPDLVNDPTKAAEDYSLNLINVLGTNPRLDVILLGMGPDGHTCSLFPGHPLLDEKKLLVAPIFDSPKPPPKRITITYPVISAARVAVFVACGEGKADILHRMVDLQEDYPAGRVHLNDGKLYWFVDSGAVSKIKGGQHKTTTE